MSNEPAYLDTTIGQPLTTLPTRLPDGKDGVAAIADLATKAAHIEFLPVDTTGLGAGLPPEVIIGVDPRTNRTFSIKELIENYRLAPARIKGVARVTDIPSFIALTNYHKVEGATAIFAGTVYPALTVTAVVNYHTAGHQPGHGDHRIIYEFPLSNELKVWMDGNRTSLDQAEFAMWLEEHCAELASPMDNEINIYEPLFREKFGTPSDLITISRELEIHANSKVRQNLRLQSGERSLAFEETHTDSSGQPVTVPGLFIISVPAWMDGDPVRLIARLRYRVVGGGVKWAYELYRPEEFIREKMKADLITIETGVGLPVWEGRPEV